ncbi:hypothetical protein DXV76_03050 [Rhodobacteraceae bacterium CCMM004]|nr:hypothetical protein DXV76_03050 [Rhodobacteraceae bacterium CCMM004]
MAELALFVTVRTKAGRRDDLVALRRAHLRPRAAENAAQSRYILGLDAEDGDVIHIAEVYERRDAFEANAAAPWCAAYMEAAGPLLDGPPTMAMAHPEWVK